MVTLSDTRTKMVPFFWKEKQMKTLSERTVCSGSAILAHYLVFWTSISKARFALTRESCVYYACTKNVSKALYVGCL